MNAPSAVLRVCLDLNIWCAAFLADKRAASGTAAQALVEAVRSSRSGDTRVQLIISWGMLSRLRKVFEIDWNIARSVVDTIIESIVSYARLGPAGEAPHLVLGGTGLMPIRDPEDGHVLDTAIAARAHLLVTANFDDFISRRSRTLIEGRMSIFETANASLIIAHPYLAAAWLREGVFPDAQFVKRLDPSRPSA